MCKEIPLSRGLVALVDDADYERVSRYNWCADGNGYAVRMESYVAGGERKRRKVMLHRFILSAPAGLLVDHINHDVLDNRRQNLRLVTVKENRANSRPRRNASSRFKGVYWHKPTQRWYATITVDGVMYHIGVFSDEVEAARAFDAKARELVGPYAYLNFPADIENVHGY